MPSRAAAFLLAGLAVLANGLPVAATRQAEADCETYDSSETPCALADGSVIGGYIRVQGGRNYFSFGVPTPDMHVSIRLTDLPADYDLYLFSDQAANPEQPIFRSVTPSTEPEVIDAVLHDVGTYVVEVVNDPSIPNAPDTPYTLAFVLQQAPATPTPEPTPEPTPTPAPAPLPTASLVSVPSVLGLSRNNATRLVHDAGLVAEISIADAFSPSGEGTVAVQDPPSAVRLGPGSTVRLGIASGRVAVPNVRGRSELDAYAVLHAAGFDIQTRRRADTAVPAGLAVGTSPGDGTILGAGTSIELSISQGH